MSYTKIRICLDLFLRFVVDSNSGNFGFVSALIRRLKSKNLVLVGGRCFRPEFYHCLEVALVCIFAFADWDLLSSDFGVFGGISNCALFKYVTYIYWSAKASRNLERATWL